MKTFTDWATENNLSIPTVNENAKRGGLAPYAYPDAYVRSQYPSNYYTPIAADAPFKLQAKSVAKGGPKEMSENN